MFRSTWLNIKDFIKIWISNKWLSCSKNDSIKISLPSIVSNFIWMFFPNLFYHCFINIKLKVINCITFKKILVSIVNDNTHRNIIFQMHFTIILYSWKLADYQAHKRGKNTTVAAFPTTALSSPVDWFDYSIKAQNKEVFSSSPSQWHSLKRRILN